VSDYDAKAPARPAGAWLIGGPEGIKLSVGRRPRWLTRLLCRWLLEWQWVEV